MIPTLTTPVTATSNRSRRIGRKALQGDRLARALSASQQARPKRSLHLPLRPRAIAITAAVVISIGVLGFAGSQFYLAQAATAQKAAAVERQSKAKASSLAADACRRKKVEQKADQIGKLTYDELYDYNECDK